MSKRHLVGGLAVVLAIAIAVPALGVDAESSLSVKKVGKKVKKLKKRVAALEATDPVPGPPGIRGVQGPPGPQGPRGPSEVFTASSATENIPNDNFGALVDVSIPPASYVFWGKVDLSGMNVVNPVQCRLRTSGADVVDAASVDSPDPNGATVALLATATTNGGDINLDCVEGTGGGGIAENVKLVAMRVGSLSD